MIINSSHFVLFPQVAIGSKLSKMFSVSGSGEVCTLMDGKEGFGQITRP